MKVRDKWLVQMSWKNYIGMEGRKQKYISIMKCRFPFSSVGSLKQKLERTIC